MCLFICCCHTKGASELIVLAMDKLKPAPLGKIYVLSHISKKHKMTQGFFCGWFVEEELFDEGCKRVKESKQDKGESKQRTVFR